VYTSGTTATPKGVILTHENLLSNFESLIQLNLITPDDCLISLLPLHHTYPFMVNLLLPILLGSKISFPLNLNLEEILDCLKKTNVTIFIGVPRIFTLLHEKIKNNLKTIPFFKKHLLQASLSAALFLRKHSQINLSKLLLTELHQKFGTHLRAMASGGAKLNAKVAGDFYKWGFSILEGYGLTETSPVVAFNMPDNFKIGSVGKPIPGVEVKIHEPDQAEIGEIIVKGKNVTSGYYKDSETTRQSIKNGWFFTRDLGYIDKDGFIFITGRKNETIVLSSGKKISPEELETYYSKSPYIKELCVFLPAGAQDKDLLTAVILPNLEYFRSQGMAQIKHRIRIEVENLSLKLPAFKRIKKYIVISENLPKTLLGKLKRFEVAKKYSADAQAIEEREKTELSTEDTLLVSTPLSQKALAHLTQRAKRPVNLDDHLELDLGLDSLERINLFFELKKIAGFELDEQQFFDLSVATVRDILIKLRAAARTLPQKEEHLNWGNILNNTLKKQITTAISIHQSRLAKIANLPFALIIGITARALFLLKVKGKNNIPKKGPFIFCPNHASYLDGPLFASALGFTTQLNTYFLGYSAYFDTPFISWAKHLLRLIPIDPASKLADTLMLCGYVLKNSKILCMFPEGSRSPDGEIKDFKRGIGILIKELNIPVIPVYIKGTHNAWPPGKTLPHPAKVEIIFGKKLTLEGLTRNLNKNVDIYQNIANNLREELLKLR
jgi:long-chain acyl-CoA synthetase